MDEPTIEAGGRKEGGVEIKRWKEGTGESRALVYIASIV